MSPEFSNSFKSDSDSSKSFGEAERQDSSRISKSGKRAKVIAELIELDDVKSLKAFNLTVGEIEELRFDLKMNFL